MNRRDFAKLSSLAVLSAMVPNWRLLAAENPYRPQKDALMEITEMMRITEHWIRSAKPAKGRDFQLFVNKHQFTQTVKSLAIVDMREVVRHEHRVAIGLALVYSVPMKHVYTDDEGGSMQTTNMQGFVNSYGRLPTMRDAKNPKIYVEYVPGRFLRERSNYIAYFDADHVEMISEIRLHMP